MAEEWYMWYYNAKTFLHNKELTFTTFDRDDHDHCEVCWATFSKYPEDNHFGYLEPISNCWVCKDCFDQFHELFGWTAK